MSDKSRRKLLKSIAAGSGAVIAGKSLPESWSRPVVNSVLLPAHAVTSMFRYGGLNLLFAVTDNDSDSIMDALVQPANAGTTKPSGDTGLATLMGSKLDIILQPTSNHGRWEGSLNTNGDIGSLTLVALGTNCGGIVDPAIGDTISASVQGFNPSSGFILDIKRKRDPVFFPLIGPEVNVPFPPISSCTI